MHARMFKGSGGGGVREWWYLPWGAGMGGGFVAIGLLGGVIQRLELTCPITFIPDVRDPCFLPRGVPVRAHRSYRPRVMALPGGSIRPNWCPAVAMAVDGGDAVSGSSGNTAVSLSSPLSPQPGGWVA